MVRRAPSPIPSADRRPPASPFQILWKCSEAARRRAGTISGRSVRARSTASGELEAPAWIIPRSDPSFGASSRGVQACASDPAGPVEKSSLIIAQRESPTDGPAVSGRPAPGSRSAGCGPARPPGSRASAGPGPHARGGTDRSNAARSGIPLARPGAPPDSGPSRSDRRRSARRAAPPGGRRADCPGSPPAGGYPHPRRGGRAPG